MKAFDSDTNTYWASGTQGAVAAIDVGAIRLNQGRHPTVEEITNLVGALPVFLFWSASVPEILSIALFFIYWALCGAVLAALAAGTRSTNTE